jgi:pyruvate dehydrogenase E2 component (dihydrolipoamide acetyltransferase)
MAFSVVMPALEMAQETGKLVAWRKAEGDSVTKGEPLLEIETDKAVLEVESPADGVLAGLKAKAGDVVPVGNIIAWIVRPGEAPPSEVVLSGAPALSEAEPTRAAAPVIARPTPGAGPQISPKARRELVARFLPPMFWPRQNRKTLPPLQRRYLHPRMSKHRVRSDD